VGFLYPPYPGLGGQRKPLLAFQTSQSKKLMANIEIADFNPAGYELLSNSEFMNELSEEELNIQGGWISRPWFSPLCPPWFSHWCVPISRLLNHRQ
jgi:hypothetical protein